MQSNYMSTKEFGLSIAYLQDYRSYDNPVLTITGYKQILVFIASQGHSKCHKNVTVTVGQGHFCLLNNKYAIISYSRKECEAVILCDATTWRCTWTFHHIFNAIGNLPVSVSVNCWFRRHRLPYTLFKCGSVISKNKIAK